MQATILLARRPEGSTDTWLRRSLVALARRFGDAHVRLLIADDAAHGDERDQRSAPPPASFDAIVLVERVKARWATALTPPQRDDALAWLSGARGHRALRREIRSHPSPQAGARSPGLVFAATAVRAPRLTHAEFDAHWRDRHAPLALRHHAGMQGYEQFAIDSGLTANAAPIDGLALLHFPDREAFAERFYDSDAGRDAILADTKRFLDLPRCEAMLMSEYGVRP